MGIVQTETVFLHNSPGRISHFILYNRYLRPDAAYYVNTGSAASTLSSSAMYSASSGTFGSPGHRGGNSSQFNSYSYPKLWYWFRDALLDECDRAFTVWRRSMSNEHMACVYTVVFLHLFRQVDAFGTHHGHDDGHVWDCSYRQLQIFWAV